jgi:hypothetical protein
VCFLGALVALSALDQALAGCLFFLPSRLRQLVIKDVP